jgi:ribosomal-protein-alanine N-acetyltransferase
MIYCVNDRPVGFLSYDLIFDRIEIEYIFVEEEYRKKDIGKSLLENLISESKKNNCLNITLEVRENNVPAINLYISKGFIGVSKRKKYYKDEDGILMIKEMH